MPYIYWIPKMHKNPYKHRFIAGSSKCSTKTLSILLTKLLTHIKQGLQKYCETAFSRSGINQMWILKNSNELLEHLKSPTFNRVTSIKSFDFSTLYTTIPHQKLKDSLTSIIRNAFMFKNGNRRYKYLVLGHEETYFVKEHSDSKSKYSEDDIIKMLEFLVDNIFVVFAGKVFQQTVGIPMGTNCAPLHAEIFLYSYEMDFIQSLLSTGKKHLASRFNLTYRYIDDVLSINNPEFENYLCQMYPAELEIKDTTESTTSASYLDLLLSIGRDGQLHTSIYDKRDDFNFHITNFPFLSSNIPSSPAYGVFISQLIRYAQACSSYECFILRARRLSSKLLKQGYLVERLKSSFRKFYGRYGDLIEQYGVTLSRMLNDILTLDQQWLPTNFMTFIPSLTFTELWVVSMEHLQKMYPAELEIKDTTESTTSASYLDLLLSIGRDGQLHTSIYDKRDDFNFHITNFPFLSSNIPSSPAYGVFISQLIRYAQACSSYECFILRARRLSSKLLKQGYLVERLKSSFRKFYGRYGDLIEQYGVTLSRMLNDILTLDQQWLPTNFMTFIPSLTFTELWVVSMEHLQRVWLASRERLPFRTLGSVPQFGTC